jgi:8-oxo-dGTP pyrophosphatase MutT (NUDIX family)
MKNMWSGISGIIENDEEPLTRAKIEIFEEVGIKENEIKLLKIGNEIDIISPQYKNHQWHVFPFLFETNNLEIKINWENSDFKWINPVELKEFDIVPSLEKVLLSLL